MNKILKLATVTTISLLCAFTKSVAAASAEHSLPLSVLSGTTGKLVDAFLPKEDRNSMRELCIATRDDRNEPKPEGFTSGIGYKRTVVNLTVPNGYRTWNRISPTSVDYAGIFGTPGLLESARTLTVTADFIAESRGFHDIARLSNLNRLIIPYTKTPYFVEVVRLLHGLRPTLTSLSLEDAGGAEDLDTRPLTNIVFERLSSLSLKCSPIYCAAVRNLATLSHLTELYLQTRFRPREEAADTLPAAIASLTNLRKLAISHNDNIGDDGAGLIATMHNLTELELFFTGISDVGATALATLPNLEKLDLRFNRIGDAGATALAAMPRLVELDLYMNPDISEAVKAALREQYPFIRFQ